MQLRNGWIAGLLLAGGCSLALEPEQTQCNDDSQCGVYDGKPIYSCVDHFCEQVRCTTDSECQARGSFVCESSACAQAQCLQDTDCSQPGEICTQGRCVDPVFGCFDKKQPLTSPDPPVIEVKILVYGEQLPVTNLGVRVCGAADLACNTPINAKTTYDEQGVLRVLGLENGKRYSLRFSGTESSGSPLQDAEYYMQRPVVGYTPEADKLEMFPEGFAALLGLSAGVPVNTSEGLVLAQIFGCDNKPLSGVSLADNRMGSPFYITGIPDPNATETDSGGVGGFVNMEVGSGGAPFQHKLAFNYGSAPMFAFTVAPRPKVVTFVQVYLGDYGSTSDRSDSAPTRR